jgi:hypothetical protein
MDLFDIHFQLEKRFRIKITHEEFRPLFMGRIPPDCTAGELHAFVCRKIEAAGRPVPHSSWGGVKLVLSNCLFKKPSLIRKESLIKADLGAM